VAVQWLEVFRLVADFATNSTLNRLLPVVAVLLVRPAASVRQVACNLWVVVLHLATLRQALALEFVRRKLGVHQRDHTVLVGQWHQLPVAEPLRRYTLVALAFGIQPARAKVLHPTRRLQMSGRHDGLLNLSGLPSVRCLVRPGQRWNGLCAAGVFSDIFAWRLKALGVARPS
jgi:hypothetical protein